jgi:hypothetical protein
MRIHHLWNIWFLEAERQPEWDSLVAAVVVAF